MTDISEIRNLIEPHGLVILGILGVAHETPLVLVGNAGSPMWQAFAGSRENSDAQPHPMDRWSKRIGTAVAAELDTEPQATRRPRLGKSSEASGTRGVERPLNAVERSRLPPQAGAGKRDSLDVVFPFDGPPYPPVLDWAKQAGRAYPSPISMFIHGKYGLWHAYRFALLLREAISGISPSAPEIHPCLSCAEQPCLSACPVDAFADDRYRVDACVAYLAASEHSDCRQRGCRARRACPVGVEFQYQAGHARFHMNAFLASQRPLKI
jgi:hypothetical protein